MYNPAEESEEGWELDIKEDVEAECSKYGKVVHTFVEGAAPGGLVWVMFAAAPAAAASAAALNGRFFAQRMIRVDYVQPTDYVSKFPETASAALQCTM
jgi:RNA-binding protein 23/39